MVKERLDLNNLTKQTEAEGLGPLWPKNWMMWKFENGFKTVSAEGLWFQNFQKRVEAFQNKVSV